MKTDPKIHALATEFSKLYDSNTLAYQYAKDVLTWLSERHCIVEKAEINTRYEEAKERYFNPEDEIEKTMYGGRMSLLEYLFPEITKEVEG